MEVDDHGRCFVAQPKHTQPASAAPAILSHTGTKNKGEYKIETGNLSVMERKVEERVKSDKEHGGKTNSQSDITSTSTSTHNPPGDAAPRIAEKKKNDPGPSHPFNNRVVESRVREKKTSEVVGPIAGSSTDRSQPSSADNAVNLPQPNGEQPVIYFEIDDAKPGKDGKKGVKVGRLKVVGGEMDAEGAEDEAEVEEAMIEGEEGYSQSDLEGHSSHQSGSRGDQMVFNVSSLLPGSVLDKQEALRQAITIPKIPVQPGWYDQDGLGKNDSSGDEYTDDDYDGDSVTDGIEGINMGAFELSLSSFGTIWNFFNCTVTDKLLAFIDERYQEEMAQLPTQGKAHLGEEHVDRLKLFTGQMSRVLPYIYQELDISSVARFYEKLELRFRHAVGCLCFETPIASLSFDEWCIVAFVMLSALGENQVEGLKTHLAKQTKKVDQFIVKCGLTKEEVNMILKVLLPLT